MSSVIYYGSPLVTLAEYAPIGSAQNDGPAIQALLERYAYYGAVYLRPGVYTVSTRIFMPNGSTLVGNPGVRIVSTMAPSVGDSPDNAVFFAAPPAATILDVTLAAPTEPGTKTIELTDASAFDVGDEIAIASTNYVAGYTIAGKAGDILTLDRVVVHAFAAGALVIDRIAPKDIRLCGRGMVVTGTGDAVVEWSGARRCLVEGLNVTVDEGAVSKNVVNFDVGSIDCQLLDCELDAGGEALGGWHFESAERCRAERVVARRATLSGFLVTAGYGCQIVQAHCEECATGGVAETAEGTNGAKGALFLGCTFVANAGTGFEIRNGGSRIAVVGCDARHNLGTGFSVNTGTGPASRVSFEGCHSFSNGGAGFYIAASVTDVHFHGCTADECTSFGLEGEGEWTATGYSSRNCALGGVRVGAGGRASVHQSLLSSSADTSLAAWAAFTQQSTDVLALRIADADVRMSGPGTKSCISSQASGTTRAQCLVTTGGTYGWVASDGTLRIGPEVDLTSCATRYLGGARVNAVALGVNVTGLKTSAYAAKIGECVLCNPAAGPFTVTLPDAVGEGGNQVEVKIASSSINAVTIDTTASQLIDGSATAVLAGAFVSLTFRSDDAGWRAI